MDYFSKPRTWVIAGVTAAVLFLLYQFWVWEVTRVEVPPGKFLVLTKLWGKELPHGEIIAPNASYKGIQLGVLPEGRHFINPLFYTYKEHPLLTIPTGKCLVVTRLYGNELDAERIARGEILVEGSAEPLTWDDSKKEWNGERGILRKPLGPGSHRLNPHAFWWERETQGKNEVAKLTPAVEIKTEEVGVRTLKVGKDPATLAKNRENPYLVPEEYRGVHEKPVPPGTYYINPFAESVIPVNVQSVTVRFTDISFPSTDGFLLNPYILVKLNVQPEMAPHLLVTLTENEALYQKYATQADVEKNEILQKIVLPLIRGYVRIEGSRFEAREFIAGHVGPDAGDKINAREKLQKELKEKIPKQCKKQGIIIEDITLDQLEIRGELEELAKQIAEREQARLQREQNKSLIEQYVTEQELKANQGLKQQEAEKVKATTLLQQAEIKAKQQKSVEKSRLETELATAKIKLDAAKQQAKATLANGKAEADIITLKNEAEVSGIRTAIQGFPSADAYAQYNIMSKLAPALTEIFASDSSEFAKLFASYMTGLNPRRVAANTNGDNPPMGTGVAKGPGK